ncbi:MAG: thioesterase family protein [Idiomarina sp.]|nr:thioesterase family protein [Idiomarina sp.]
MPTSPLLAQISTLMNEQIPFHRLIGLEVTRFASDISEVQFRWKPELIGNAPQGILHGGVTATALDMCGGLVGIASVVEKLPHDTAPEEVIKRISRCGTIDLRVDYVRPGRGETFITTAHIIRSGNKVAVARMELHNQDNMLIAFGTGTYMVG